MNTLNAKISRRSALLGALSTAVLAGAAQAQDPGRSDGNEAPVKHKLMGSTVDGVKLNLEQTAGKAVLITFWATWCPTCREELPGLRNFYAAQRANGFEWISMSIDEKIEDILNWRTLLRTMKVDVMNPIVWNRAPGLTHSFGRVTGTPTHFVINRKGEEVYKMRGAANPRLMNTLTEQIKQRA
jgi:cytochrome c biogenesis protein CcmG, thiol:disulfide interchange protein DsbE